MKTDKQIAASAAEFAERWKGKGYERGQSQLFWADLLTNVFGVENLLEFLRYEEQVESMVDSTNFIDVHIPSTKVLIEQKSINIDLRKPIKKGDGFITPFLQAKLYIVNMPQNQHPKWVVTCNFKSFLVYDMNQPNKEPEEILLEDLGTEYYRLKFLVDAQSEHISKEMEPAKLTKDNVFARAKGGEDSLDNIIMVCKECNSSKGKMDLFEWYATIRKQWPPINVLVHYLKNIYLYSVDNGLMDKHLMILEYKESIGQWHYNMIWNNAPKSQPDTYGWDSIAYTEERKARVFTYMMDCKMHQRVREGLEPYKTEEIKKEWKLFCYVYNSIIRNIEISDEDKAMAEKYFDDTVALARLGHAAFSDVKEDYELDDAWEYDTLSFKDSNF